MMSVSAHQEVDCEILRELHKSQPAGRDGSQVANLVEPVGGSLLLALNWLALIMTPIVCCLHRFVCQLEPNRSR